MGERKESGKRINGIDLARVICAILIVAIHTSPLKDINELANVFFVRGIAVIAVPFFFMVTGYFLANKFEGSIKEVMKSLKPYIMNIVWIYIIWSIIYFPFTISKLYLQFGQNAWLTFFVYVRDFFLRGSASHLWYLASSIVGLLLMPFIVNIKQKKARYALLFSLFAIGLLGNSYFGLISNIGILAKIKRIIDILGTTRNGLFFGLPCIYLGYYLRKKDFRLSKIKITALLVLFISLLLAETYFVYYFNLAFANNLYIFLLPTVMFFFLFSANIIKTSIPGAYLRDISLGVYLVHPLIGELLRFMSLSSLVKFFLMALLSILASIVFISLRRLYQKRAHNKARI